MNAGDTPAPPPSSSGPTRWLSRQRLIVLAALAALLALTWSDLLRRSGALTPAAVGQHLAMPQTASYGPGDLVMTAAMWIVMMVAMMLPAAVPMVLLFLRMAERRRASGRTVAPTGTFVLGYLLVWTGFSLLATGVQWGLHAAALLSPHLTLLSPAAAGLVLIAAGAFQFSRLKWTCLAHCQSPLDFLGAHWREGVLGAVRMGLDHGVYCLGCCWALMLLLFVGGVMNLAWIAVLTTFVLVERIVAKGRTVSWVAGTFLVLWGLGLVTGTIGR